MHGYEQSWCGHKDEEEVVVADILATGLLRVARKNSDAEDEEDGEPDLPEAGGVFVDAAQLGIEGPPTHCRGKDPGSSCGR
uniref:Uncharacterized protein n=1 Tax=Cyprinodon variegatus TaxID=28743 RepID=A0A3Q2D7X2_CYPVA